MNELEKDTQQQESQPRIIHRDDHRALAVSLRDAMSRLFDESFWSPFDFSHPLKSLGGAFPKVDITETHNEINVVANVPGVDPDKIEVEVHDDVLRISGSTEKSQEENNEKIYRYEREYGSFHREFSLPTRVKADQVQAKVKNGVLTIRLPKAEEAIKKKIQIEKE